ncbi:MAG TPA: hypothetical protein DCG49_08165, partial [Ruminococcus sp.]|nr:hypothetical protein [Ruminococcus sp.]
WFHAGTPESREVNTQKPPSATVTQTAARYDTVFDAVCRRQEQRAIHRVMDGDRIRQSLGCIGL